MKVKASILILFIITQTHARQSPPEKMVCDMTWCLTEIMYHDVVNPPAAARFYSYSLLAGYEILSQINHGLPRFQDAFRNYPFTQQKSPPGTYNHELAVAYGILETGRLIIPSGYLLEKKQEELVNRFAGSEFFDSSIALAKRISAKIVAYAKSDGYFSLSTLQRYTPLSNDSSWRPTAPEYMSAVEPHWRRIRPFFLDSAAQFKPKCAVPFDKTPGSSWISLTKEVYETGTKLNAEQKLIANYWDCNPFAVQFQGHMSIGLKKISPGGHWMSIAGIAAMDAKLSLENTLLLQTVLALALHDAFISCWDEKFRSNRIRPETAINRYIDEKWKPFLQTPPFPEYSSGHSVISSASAELLSHLLGDAFIFTDTTETYLGMPSRQFNSFRDAAAEARISRLYGGIHFRDAIENGGEQGRLIGQYIIGKIGAKRIMNKEQGIKSKE